MPIRIAAALALAAALAAGGAQAQTAMPMDHGAHHAGMSHGAAPAGAMPTLPGQDAFGTIQEIVAILEADPATDWSKVDIEALRRHLVDMNEVTLNARAAVTPIDGGARFEVTGEGRTLDSIRRMVLAHAHEIDGTNGWSITAETLPNGALLTVKGKDAAQAARIRGLGFIGIMAQGSHHQAHHLAMARGGFSH